MYSPQVLDHFQHPRNSGRMDSPDVSVQVENPACGDVMTLMLRVQDGVIQTARYLVRGCVASIACGSALAEALSGKSVAQAAQLRREDIVETVGGLPAESTHASYLAVDALKLALKQLAK
jgi:nitrogen fixation NifU-like protein